MVSMLSDVTWHDYFALYPQQEGATKTNSQVEAASATSVIPAGEPSSGDDASTKARDRKTRRQLKKKGASKKKSARRPPPPPPVNSKKSEETPPGENSTCPLSSEDTSNEASGTDVSTLLS